jgi:hypothetical protein
MSCIPQQIQSRASPPNHAVPLSIFPLPSTTCAPPPPIPAQPCVIPKPGDKMASTAIAPSPCDPINRAAINRANSQHSTGPRSEAGKQRSARNALTHGLTARTAVLPSEDPAAFQQHRRQFLEEYRPATPTETQLVHELADTSWRLNRIPLLEAGVLTQNCSPASARGHPSPGRRGACDARPPRPAPLPPVPQNAGTPPRNPTRTPRARRPPPQGRGRHRPAPQTKRNPVRSRPGWLRFFKSRNRSIHPAPDARRAHPWRRTVPLYRGGLTPTKTQRCPITEPRP